MKPDIKTAYKKQQLDRDIIVAAEKAMAPTLNEYTVEPEAKESFKKQVEIQNYNRMNGGGNQDASSKPRRRKGKFMKRTSKSSKLQKRMPETSEFERVKKVKNGPNNREPNQDPNSEKSVVIPVPFSPNPQMKGNSRNRSIMNQRPQGQASLTKGKNALEQRPRIRGFNLSSIVGKQDETEGKPWVEWKLIEKNFFKPVDLDKTEEIVNELFQADQSTNILLEKDMRECIAFCDVLDANKTHLIKTLISRKNKASSDNAAIKAHRFHGIGYFRVFHRRGSQASTAGQLSEPNEAQASVSEVNLKSSMDRLEKIDGKTYNWEDYFSRTKDSKDNIKLPELRLRAFVPLPHSQLADMSTRQERFSKVFRKLNDEIKSNTQTCVARYTSKSELFFLKEEKHRLESSVASFLNQSQQDSLK